MCVGQALPCVAAVPPLTSACGAQEQRQATALATELETLRAQLGQVAEEVRRAGPRLARPSAWLTGGDWGGSGTSSRRRTRS